MENKQELKELKDQIKVSIRHNSDRGFVPYGVCMRVCGEMQAVMNTAEQYMRSGNYQHAFDIYIMVLLEAMRLLPHSDDSSGCCGDIIYGCLSEIDKLCKITASDGNMYYFNAILKAAKNKVFSDWAEDAYSLLKSAAYFVHDAKQAEKIYELFPILGTMYSGKDYPDKLLITHYIIEKLEGKAEADKYLMAHIDVSELRTIAAENAFADKNYELAERLCLEALEKRKMGYSDKSTPWPYFLERLYSETGDDEKYLDIVRYILFRGNTSYFEKLKMLYQQSNVWEQKKETLWQELSKSLASHDYMSLLSDEGELAPLLEMVKQHKSYLEYYGKQLAAEYPDETYKIYEEYILEEAADADNRIKYRKVCKIIKDFAETGEKTGALEIIDRLSKMYPRRAAMQDELAKLSKRLGR